MRRDHRIRILQRTLLLGAAGLALQLPPAPAAAQTGSASRVEEALRQTDEALSRAQDVVVESESQRARDVLENANRVQTNAWGQFRARRHTMAAQLTVEAREMAARAVTFAREETSLRNRARREGEKAGRALSLAREQIGNSTDSQVHRLLEQAAALIERGRVKFGEQRYAAALRLAVSAQQLVRQAVGLLGDGSVDGSLRVVRELERTDQLIERTGVVVDESGNPEALRLLEQGRDLQARAWEGYRADRFRAAMAGTREARNVVNRARALAQGPIAPEAVSRALAETQRLLEHAANVVTDSGNEQAASLLERARNHQARADRFLADEELRKALAETRVARSLIKRSLRLLDRDDVR